ncbi:MAG: LysR family transcriptional regulator [Spirochaetia bacterium]|nr:LysR family transcriptional regulator [Spirochaetia bacterium]
MNLKQILYFLQIYRDESFTKAAANLAVTQPALSLQIAQLEKELGFSLLDRNPGRIEVTGKGKTFLIHAVDILDSFQNLENALKQNTGQPMLPEQLNIAAGGAICAWVLPDVIGKLKQSYPDVRINILEGDRNFIRHTLLTGRSDYTISTEKIHDHRIESRYFCSDRIVPVIAVKSRAPGDLKSLKDFPVLFYHSGSSIQNIVEERLIKLNLHGKLNVVMELHSLISLIKSVEAGLGIGFISELSKSTAIKILTIEDLYCQRKFYIYYRKKRSAALSETAAELANIAQKLPNIRQPDY